MESEEEEFSNPDSFRSRNSDSLCPSAHNSSMCNNGGFSSGINDHQDMKNPVPSPSPTPSPVPTPTPTTNPNHLASPTGNLTPNPSNVRRSASGVLRCVKEDDPLVHDDPLIHDDHHEGRHALDDEDESENLLPNELLHSVLNNENIYDNDSLFHDGQDSLHGLTKQLSLMRKSYKHSFDAFDGCYGTTTAAALTEIRCQLSELTRSVENCQSDVFEVRQDMLSIKQEIDSVQMVTEEIDYLRDAIDHLESEGERRKAKLMEQGLTFFLGYSIFAAVLGMLQFGYNTGVINAPESVIEKFIRFAYRKRYGGQNMTYEASTFLYAIAVAIFALGGMCGGVVGGWIANKFGRKGGLLFNNVVGIFGAAAMGMAKFSESYELLIAGRFLIGVNCGLNTSLVPMYISEIAPLNLRGGLGTINQLAVTVGLLISQILGIENLLGSDDFWPYLLGTAIVPSILQLLLLPFCPESPRYLLITRQHEGQARQALKNLRNTSDIDADIAEMRAEELAQQAEAKITMMELLRSPSLKLPLLIAVVMQLSQQLSGINAVFYYSTNLFITTGLSESHAKYATIGIGAVMVAMTLISIPLMDKSGRRTLHLYGLGGMFIFSIFITISFLVKELVAWIWWLSVVSTLFYVVFFAVGPGSIPWMITAELFSQGPRPAAMSIAVLVNWSANFFVGMGFPTMQTTLENYTFLPFSVFLAIFWIFTYRKVPETKNKTFDEIATLFRAGQKQRSISNYANSIGRPGCEHKPMMVEKVEQPHPGDYAPHVKPVEYPPLMDNYGSDRSSPNSVKSPSPDDHDDEEAGSEQSSSVRQHPHHLDHPDDDETCDEEMCQHHPPLPEHLHHPHQLQQGQLPDLQPSAPRHHHPLSHGTPFSNQDNSSSKRSI